MISKTLSTTASALGLAIGLSSPATAEFRELCGETLTDDTLVSGVAEILPGCTITIEDGATLTIDTSFLRVTSELRLVGYGSANLEIKDSDILQININFQFQDGDILLSNNSNIGRDLFGPSTINITSYGDITIIGNRFALSENYSVYSVAGQIRFDNNQLVAAVDREIELVSNTGDISIKDNYILGTDITVESQSGTIDMSRNKGLDCGLFCQRELQISTLTGAIDLKDNILELKNGLSIISDSGDIKIFRNVFGEPSGGATISTAGNCSTKDNSPSLSCP